MKLVIFGLTVTSSWGNGHATLWRGLIRALGERGHRVVFYERDVPYYARNRDAGDLDGGALCLYRDWTEIEPRAVADLIDCDAALVTSFCPDAEVASDAALALAPRAVFYDMDAPVTLEAHRRGERVDYLPDDGYARFDLVLSFTGGETLPALRRELGARRVAPLYGSVDPERHRRVAPAAAWAATASYLGTYASDRQPALEALFFEPARRMPDQSFLLGGAMYPEHLGWPGNVRHIAHVAPPDHPALYSSSRVTINVTRAPMAQVGYCPSGRLFEAAACGTPVVTDAWPGLDEFFTPDREIFVCTSAAEAAEVLSRPPAELASVGGAARERVLSEHTADHRAAELLDLLGSLPAGSATASGAGASR